MKNLSYMQPDPTWFLNIYRLKLIAANNKLATKQKQRRGIQENNPIQPGNNKNPANQQCPALK